MWRKGASAHNRAIYFPLLVLSYLMLSSSVSWCTFVIYRMAKKMPSKPKVADTTWLATWYGRQIKQIYMRWNSRYLVERIFSLCECLSITRGILMLVANVRTGYSVNGLRIKNAILIIISTVLSIEYGIWKCKKSCDFFDLWVSALSAQSLKYTCYCFINALTFWLTKLFFYLIYFFCHCHFVIFRIV